MLDMSKAFDTMDRAIFLQYLKTILNPDELYLIKIMFDTELTVRCETEESDFFDTVVPQGDGLSANELTLYLLRALWQENNDLLFKKSTITTSYQLSSIWKHSYHRDIDEPFAIYQKYTDHISAITTDKDKIGHIKKAVRSKLEVWNLQVNEIKTEEYETKRNENESWHQLVY